MKRLNITSVRKLNFGRHGDFSLDGLGSPFTVVYGENESGKSTLAEFLVWAIGGPWRTFGENTEAFRHGPTDFVDGDLHGAFGDDEFDLYAKFQLLQKGNPKDFREGSIGAAAVDKVKWSERLGGITMDDYVLIYRLYGATLGDKGSVKAFSTLFSQFALGSAVSSVNPREALKKIGERRKVLEKSIKELTKVKKDIESQIKKASEIPDEISRLEDELESVRHQMAKNSEEETQLARQKALVERVLDGFVHLEELELLRGQLKALPVISPERVAVVEKLDQITSAVEHIESATEQIAESADQVAEAIAEAGVARNDLAGRTLNPQERVELNRGATAVMRARRDLAGAEDDVRDREGDQSDLVQQAARAAQALGLSAAQLSDLTKIGSTLPSLLSRADQWVQETDGVIRAEAELQAAKELGSASTRTSPGGKSGGQALVLVALAAVGALGLLHPIAGLTGAIVAALVFASGRVPIRLGAGVETKPNDAVLLAELERKARESRLRAAGHQEHLAKSLGSISGLIAEPDFAKPRLQALINLHGIHESIGKCESDLSLARGRRNEALPKLATAEDQAKALFATRGIAIDLIDDDFDEWLAKYEVAVNAAANQDRLQVGLAGARSEYDTLVSAVAGELSGLSPNGALEKVRGWSSEVDAFHVLQSKVREAEMKVNAANMGSDEVKATILSFPDEASLEVEVDRLVLELEAAKSKHVSLIEKRTGIENTKNELDRSEVLPGLNLRLGEAESDLEEIEGEKDAVVLAEKVLGEIIDTYERENQDPVIALASSLVAKVVPGWGSLIMRRDESGNPQILRNGVDGSIDEHAISDGGRALLYLGLRLAFAKQDAERRGVSLPLICDDPLVHFDDERSLKAISLFAEVSAQHQVIMFTCEKRTRDHAVSLGATVVEI